MTQSPTTKELSKAATLVDAIEQHCVKEKVSFHTPGHKGGSNFCCEQNLWAMDVTELPGLDELAYADGILAKVQERAADAFGAQASFISTNGASAALIAAIVACANRGSHILVPRNVHRSVVNALVLTGLEPIWYKPSFDREWNIWGAVDEQHFLDALHRVDSEFLPYDRRSPRIAAALVVSPTYGGAISPLKTLVAACHEGGIPVIVDEAHGAHAPNAVAAGADLVVHSLHKTLSGMTQTGLLHCSPHSLVAADDVRLALNMLQSSSPNYVLMASIEAAIKEYLANGMVKRAAEFAEDARQKLAAANVAVYASEEQDAFHLLIRVPGLAPETLFDMLAAEGIFAESILGNGVLLLFGCGSKATDVDLLCAALQRVRQGLDGTKTEAEMSVQLDHSDTFGTQVLLPKLAYFSKTEKVSLADAVGRISAECVAPCPPGNPVLVPGQRVTAKALELCKMPALRVVLESQQGEH